MHNSRPLELVRKVMLLLARAGDRLRLLCILPVPLFRPTNNSSVVSAPLFEFAHRRFPRASTSSSPFPLENTGLSIVPPIRKGNCNLPFFNVAPERRAIVLVKKLSLV